MKHRIPRIVAFAWLLPLVLLAPGGAVPATGAPEAGALPQLLLSWRTHVEYEGEFDDESLIYRDGLVVRKWQRLDKPFLGNYRVGYYRAQAKPGALANLAAALSQNHIGRIAADGCKAVNILPTGGSYDALLIWFGRGGRQNRLEFGSVGSVGAKLGICPHEVNAIALAVNAYFVDGITYTDGVTTTP